MSSQDVSAFFSTATMVAANREFAAKYRRYLQQAIADEIKLQRGTPAISCDSILNKPQRHQVWPEGAVERLKKVPIIKPLRRLPGKEVTADER